ncbi:hypothetical protein B0H17DRAFT_1004972 [Mycena rosella]|uniref:Transforming growth factor beta regulator 1 n=1 Tax=Mycena rosella TaxID=1033263 RepID=A0AAD7DWJ0_MYCRO|nr:hypothetical protein B0H17DRAFT_1004972 [Mycena rosella]
MREERNILLDRIIELEAQPGFVAPPAGVGSPTETSPSGAFPRSLLNSRARTSFTQNLRDAAAEDDADADAEIDPALSSRRGDAPASRSPRRTRGNQNIDANGEGDDDGNESGAPAETPVMVSTTGTRLRIRPIGGEDLPADLVLSPASSNQLDAPSPDSTGMPVDDGNDDSGEYSPPSKGNKRTRDHADYNGDALVAVSPEPKAPRRSSRRSAAATAAPTSAPRTRVIQGPTRRVSVKPAAAAPAAGPPPPEEAAPAPKTESPAPGSASTNGHAPSDSPSTRPASLAFNPYYPYLAPSPSTTPNPYANPYAYYMSPPMPAAYMPPPPQFAPPRPRAEAGPRATKPKRLKAHTVTSKNYSIPLVPRDKSGKPMLPLNVGIMTVIGLGAVCMREHFHTERYIFPVGYEVTRRYLSTVDPVAEVVYHCTILDGGDGPKFQIIPADVPDRPVIAGTATGAWSAIVKQANAIRQRAHSNSVSGPDFFGLGQNTIKHLIQELPNADRLRDYVWQQFVEGGPLGGRHAAVIPALPEEYEGGRLVGAYYPPREGAEEKRGSYYPPHILAQAAPAAPAAKRQDYRDGSRVVLPPGGEAGGSGSGGGSGGSGSYYLPHTQQQTRASPPPPPAVQPPYPGPPNGNGYDGSNGNVGGSFASLMNAFPTQEGGGADGGGGGPS